MFENLTTKTYVLLLRIKFLSIMSYYVKSEKICTLQLISNQGIIIFYPRMLGDSLPILLEIKETEDHGPFVISNWCTLHSTTCS